MDQKQSQKGSSKVELVENMNNKRRLTEDQVRILERNFNYERKLEQEHKYKLAEQLGIPARQVAVWYQNKRARWRTQALEVDCTALHRKLDTALAHNRRLQREVLALRAELNMALQALQSTNNHNTNYNNNNNNDGFVPSYCTDQKQEQEQEGNGSWSSFSDDHHQYEQFINEYDHLDHHHHDYDDDQLVQIDDDFFSNLIDW